MTIKTFFLYSFLQWAIYTFLKVWFFNNQIFENSGWQVLVYWTVIAAVAAALSRRYGVINYLEAFFLVIFWTLSGLLMDLLVTSIYTGLDIFSKYDYWAGFLVMGLAILLFHKKRHIHIRKEHLARHHH